MTPKEILLFCRKHGMKHSSFGRKAMSDPRFVSQVLAGRTLRPTTVERVRKFMEEYP